MMLFVNYISITLENKTDFVGMVAQLCEYTKKLLYIFNG